MPGKYSGANHTVRLAPDGTVLCYADRLPLATHLRCAGCDALLGEKHLAQATSGGGERGTCCAGVSVAAWGRGLVDVGS